MSTLRFFALGLILALALFTTACGDDNTASSSCQLDDDCQLGTVCGASNTCVEAACEFCTGDQICYETEENPQGTCSKPECTSDDQCKDGDVCRDFQCASEECVNDGDCGPGQRCTLAGTCEEASCSGPEDCPTGTFCGASGACEDGCDANDDCPEGEACDTSTNTCVAGCMGPEDCADNEQCVDSACVCTPGGCAAGSYCDETSGSCIAANDCSQIMCPQGDVCDETTLECVAGCQMGECAAEDPNTVCDLASGLCVPNTCPGQDPNQCDPNSDRNTWDPAKCFCAECLTDDECTGAGEVCTAGGSCFACQTVCDAQTPGTCAQGQYCIDECCVDCIGAADCANGELCIDGQCAPAPDCTQDPSVCPNGYTCNNGNCDPPMTGGGVCNPADPNSCPAGTFCDPNTFMCGLPGGINLCGLCNADCTCPGSECSLGFICTGCNNDAECPSGTTCQGFPGLLSACI